MSAPDGRRRLDEVLKILAGVDSPLSELERRVDGVKLAAEQSELKRFLISHEKLIRSLVVPQHAVSEALRLLKQEIEDGGSTAIDNPETLDSAELLDALKELKDFVCRFSGNVSLLRKVWRPGLVLVCVDGVIGACLIVIDITGALAVPHLTAFVLVKAVKSTWSGCRLIKRVIKEGEGMWASWKTAIKQYDLKQTAKERGTIRLKGPH